MIYFKDTKQTWNWKDSLWLALIFAVGTFTIGYAAHLDNKTNAVKQYIENKKCPYCGAVLK